jgi:large subunit ribosomal protein L19
MKNKIIADIEAAQLKQDLPDFSPGDTVVVQVKVKEGQRERQASWRCATSKTLLPT